MGAGWGAPAGGRRLEHSNVGPRALPLYPLSFALYPYHRPRQQVQHGKM